jgi:S-adenosyl-L-methionine hydrolase (adenosine-forming)
LVVTFLSDYGLHDEFVGVCHAVMASVAPEVRVVDLTHAIGRHDVRRGALALRRAAPFAPAGSIHLAVVDPGVGSERRAVAVRAGDRILVGPDNGLLLPAATLLGGPVEAVDIGASRHRLEPVSATFHGRDVFAPVAAALAAGAPLHDAGEPLNVATLAPLELPTGRIVAAGHAQAHVLDIDTFGNVDLDLDAGTLPELVRVNGQRAAVVRTFADVPVGELLIYTDSSGALALAVNQGSAAEVLNLELDAEVRIEWTP